MSLRRKGEKLANTIKHLTHGDALVKVLAFTRKQKLADRFEEDPCVVVELKDPQFLSMVSGPTWSIPPQFGGHII